MFRLKTVFFFIGQLILFGPTNGRMSELILIMMCFKRSFVSGTAIAIFFCGSFCTFPTVYRTEYISMRFTNRRTISIRTRSRAIPLGMITMGKSIHGFSYTSMGFRLTALRAAGAPLKIRDIVKT